MAADDGLHEIQLNGKQLVFLFMASTVVAVVIFLCGVMVGRGVRAQRPALEAAVEAATDPTSGATSAVPLAPGRGRHQQCASRRAGDADLSEPARGAGACRGEAEARRCCQTGGREKATEADTTCTCREKRHPPPRSRYLHPLPQANRRRTGSSCRWQPSTIDAKRKRSRRAWRAKAIRRL